MALFRDENPNLGASTTVKELSGFGSGNPIVSYFKPTTRETIQVYGLAAATAAGYCFIAPWACQVVAIRFTATTTAAAGTVQLFKTPQASLPAAPATTASGNVVAVFSTALTFSGSNNATVNATNVAGAGASILAPGDQLNFSLGGTLGSLAGGLLQIEIVQIG